MRKQRESVHPRFFRSEICQWLLVILPIFCLPLSLHADTLSIDDHSKHYEVWSYLDIASEAGDIGTFDRVRFEDLDYELLAQSKMEIHDQQWYWLRLTVSNATAVSMGAYNWVLKFPLIVTDAEYMLVRDSIVRQSGKTGFFVPLQERTFLPGAKGNFAHIALPPGESTTIYMRVRCDRYGVEPDLRLELSTATTFFEQQKKKKLFNGLFVGFVLLLLLYNLFLFFLAHDDAYVYYSLYLAALCLFTVYNTGDLWDWVLGWFQPEKPQWIAFFKLITYVAVIAYLEFLRVFLNLEKLLPRWDKGLRWFGSAAILMLLLDGYLIYQSNYNYNAADFITVGYFFIFLVVMVWFLIPLARTQDGKRTFIIAGVVAMVLGILLTLIDRMRTVEFSTLYYKITTIIELVIFSLGLAYRQREAEQETQQAAFALERSRLLQAQKEQEAEQLAALDTAKSRFYTHLTHELRTPLTVINGLQDYLKRKINQSGLSEQDQTDWHNSLALIGRNSDQLLVHINQLLELAKLEAGNLPVRYQQGNIITYLNYLTESFYSLAKEREIRLLFYPECDALEMDYDDHKLQQIIYNLLSNALKYTPAGGKVVLHARFQQMEGKDHLQLKVSDNGRGMGPEALKQIFELFYQSNEGNSGSGVGLTLTKELVELLGGTITVESELEKGSTFTIMLPITNYAPVLAPSAVSVARISAEENALISEEGTISHSAAEATEKPVLLIVEDNKDVMTFLEKLLQQDYQLHTAADGERGVALAIEEVPDIIISDVMMPGIDGFELCRQLKSDDRTSHIPIVLLTAKATDADRIEGLRTGADAYLMKPFNAEELFLRLSNLFQLRKRIQLQLRDEGGHTAELPGEETKVAVESAFLKRLKELISEHLDQPDLSTSFLAREMHLSESQLYRKLKALTEQSPSVFIRGERLRHGAELLRNLELQVAEVAYQCGFNDPNYFSRAFHQQYGQSPRDYRTSLVE